MILTKYEINKNRYVQRERKGEREREREGVLGRRDVTGLKKVPFLLQNGMDVPPSSDRVRGAKQGRIYPAAVWSVVGTLPPSQLSSHIHELQRKVICLSESSLQ